MVNWTKYDIANLYEWAENGMPKTVDEDFAKYVNMLSKIFNMRMRFDVYGEKEAIINHLIAFEPDLQGNRLQALKLYNESMEYFYGSTDITKKAHLNRYADDLDKDITLARKLAQNVGDIEKISKMIKVAADIRERANPDDDKLPDEMFNKPFKVYTFDMNHFEIGNEDAELTEKWIDEKIEQMTPKAIERIKQEAMVSLPIKVFAEDVENPRKD